MHGIANPEKTVWFCPWLVLTEKCERHPGAIGADHAIPIFEVLIADHATPRGDTPLLYCKAKYIAVAVDTPEGTLSSLYVQEGNPIAILFGGSIETVGSSYWDRLCES